MYLLLARNHTGILEINRFLSVHLQQQIPFPKRPSPGENIFIVYPLDAYDPGALLSHERIGVQVTEVNKLFGANTAAFPDKFVIRHPVTFKDRESYNAHRMLRAIDKNILHTRLQPSDIAGAHERLAPPDLLLDRFKQHPDIIANTFRLMESCTAEMDFKTDKTKKSYSNAAENDGPLLEKLALEGMRKRYGTGNKKAAERVSKELEIIKNTGFNAYFLIAWDIIRYAKSRGFFYVGRGSGANSIIAYCLEITDVDPLGLNLYFERFLNPHRVTPPDFDIDFSWKDRDEIIDYIFKRYGNDRVCLLGSYTTFQYRALLRELGKVFGLPKEEIDLLEKGDRKEDGIRKQIWTYSHLLKDFPNHLSIHAGGMLISEEPICQYTAVELPPKGFPTSQIDMHIAEKIGLYKLDILSQRGLGHIRETMDLVKHNHGVQIDIHNVERFKQDKLVAERIRKADSIGCFYIESPAMRQLLMKLKCDDYLTLVAASSIIRPGVAQSGMMRQYIHRYHHPKDFEYLHPTMKALLEETYGVMVYQEDVIKVAHHFAGLDMSEADVLRRAMSGKYRGQVWLEKIKEKFFANCRERKYPDKISAEVWRQIESFGGYSFSKAHSASFAVESYQSLFLKTYYPVEFLVAVINNFGGFYNREVYFYELRKTDAIICAPCINRSQRMTSVKGKEVFIGLIHLEGLEETMIERLLEERIRNGEYRELQDFIERLAPALSQLNILIRIGAFRFTGRNKKELLWEANLLQKKNARHPAEKTLFAEQPINFRLPALRQYPLDDALDEMELLGFPLCNVFDLSEEDPFAYITAKQIPQYKGKEIRILGYLITTKSAYTIRRETMYFGTFIDAQGDWIDTVHFPETASRFPLSGRGFYQICGRVTEEFGVFAVEAHYCKKTGVRSRAAFTTTIGA